MASLNLTKAITLSGHMTAVIMTVNQTGVSKSRREHVHISEAVFAAPYPSQTSLLAAERHILQTRKLENFEEVKYIIQARSNTAAAAKRRKDRWQKKIIRCVNRTLSRLLSNTLHRLK